MARLPLAFHQHDHAACVRRALQDAERICKRRGARLTPLRSAVLTLLWQSHRPLGAYDILEQLTRKPGRRPTPATVYRALDFLREQDLVHRIACLNAYIGCAHPGQTHAGQFLICTRCGQTQELDSDAIDREVERAATALGFAIRERAVEIAGTCPACQQETETIGAR